MNACIIIILTSDVFVAETRDSLAVLLRLQILIAENEKAN